MTSILAGHTAPPFVLSSPDGRSISLEEVLRRGPAVVAFFKISCPVCQLALPFLERLHQRFPDDRVCFLGVSQDEASDTREFCAEFGVSFPTVMDEDGYPASNAYGLTNVPTVFLIDQEGRVQIASVGFEKAAIEKISAEIARMLGVEPAEAFRPGELVPDYVPG
jgi:peroxiredoxin